MTFKEAQDILRDCLNAEAKALEKFGKAREAYKQAQAATVAARKEWNRIEEEQEDSKP